MSELVSIVMPAYNSAKFIGQAIESVQAQSYKNWQLVVSDDCSPDKTRDILSDFAGRDARIVLAPREINGGPAAARNKALSMCDGRYIAFLDSDDWWLPQKLERQLEFMAARKAALSYTQFRRVNQDGEDPGSVVSIPEELSYRQLLGNTAIATSTAIVDRQLTGPFKMTQTYYDDFVLWLGLLKSGHVAQGLQEDLMRYRVVQGSISRGKVNSAKKVWRTYRDIEGLGVLSSSYYFANYAMNALKKYSKS